MKVKDYMRLGKISLKARKKSTRGTVRGISFGLILLMPLFFLVLAFYIGLNSSVDKEPSIRTFNISYYNRVRDPEKHDYYTGILYSDINTVKSIKGVESYVDYRDYSFDVSSTDKSSDKTVLSYSIDGSDFSYIKKPSVDESEENNNYNKSSNDKNVYFKVIDTKNSNAIFLKSDYENGNPIINGNSFSDEPKNEIMLSSKFLNDNNLDNNIVGKKLSLKYEAYSGSKGNTTTSETQVEQVQLAGAIIPLFNDYKIVGIYDSNILKNRNSDSNEYFWMSSESFLDSSNQSTLPRVVSISDQSGNYSQNYYFYQDNKISRLANDYVNDGCAFFPLGICSNDTPSDSFVAKEYLTFESYGKASNAVEQISELYNKVLNNPDYKISELAYSSLSFFTYRIFYQVFMYLSFALGIFGGVIFFATLLNLYNTINFSVQIRKNYLGLLRAVGMKDNDITKMYFFEIIQIFLRSYIWTIIFGGLICAGINIGFNYAMGMKEVKEFMPFTMSLNPVFIFISFIVLALITFIIALIFAVIACYNVSRKPILEVLVDDK